MRRWQLTGGILRSMRISPASWPALTSVTSRLAACLTLLTLLHTGVAHAAMNCSITRTSGVSFGSYDSTRTYPLDSAGLVAFRCSNISMGGVP